MIKTNQPYTNMSKSVTYKGYPIRQKSNPYLKDLSSWTVDGLELDTLERIKEQIDAIEEGRHFGSGWEKFKIS